MWILNEKLSYNFYLIFLLTQRYMKYFNFLYKEDNLLQATKSPLCSFEYFFFKSHLVEYLENFLFRND